MNTAQFEKKRAILAHLVAGTLAMACPAFANQPLVGELNTLREVRVSPARGGTEVAIVGSLPPVFTVFRLSEPERLVVDISSATASSVQGHQDGQGAVEGVVTSQFSDAHASVARILLALKQSVPYDVRAKGATLVVSVGTNLPGPAPLPNLVASRSNEHEVKHPAKHVTALSFHHDTLDISADGEIGKYEILELTDPPRLALDLYGVDWASKVPKIHSAQLNGIRVGAHSHRVRLVLDVRGKSPRYQVVQNDQGLQLVLSPGSAKPLENAVTEVATPAKSEITEVVFLDETKGGKVDLQLSPAASWRVDRPDDHSAVLTLDSTSLPKRLERSFDTSALDTPIKMVSAFAVSGDKTRVVVSSREAFEEKVLPSPKGLTWQLTAKAIKPEQATVQAKAASMSTQAPAAAISQTVLEADYVGKRVSFEFKDIDIHNLLRVMAEVSKKNIVVADDVKGTVTIRLHNVPWDQALELILRSKGLGKEEMGNIVRVAPLKTLEEEAKLREERRKALVRQEELLVQLIPVNYAVAADMSARVKDVLSERGTVTVDTRTNVLIIRDIQNSIMRAKSLVKNLDTQTPQVLIESRIVEANVTYTKQIGVQWGGQAQATPGTGNPTGLIFPNSVVATGGSATSTAPQGVSTAPNFAVNLPAAVGEGSGGALGFVFGSAGGALGLNLRLSALESMGTVKTISAPKVTTLDNNTAKISQGVSIPFSQSSAQGVNTVFVDARLSLEVTPHITQDASILMAIKAENNQPDPANTGANGQPAIQRKEATTQVLVKDGDTTVIGGIYVRRGSTVENGIPFLSKIPILGFFFKNNSDADNRQELLIFITPRIINRQTITQTP